MALLPREPIEAPTPTHGYKNPCCDFSPAEQEAEDSLTCAGCNHCTHCHKGWQGDGIEYGCESMGVSPCDLCPYLDDCLERDCEEVDNGLTYQELCDAVWGEDFEGEMDWDDAPGFHD